MDTFFLAFSGLVAFGFSFFFLYIFYGMVRTKVPFVPTQKKIAQKMIELAKISSQKNIYELGSGNGKILFEAKKALQKSQEKNKSLEFLSPTKKYNNQITGKWIGFELIQPLVLWSRFQNWWHNGNIQFQCRSFFTADLSDADIIFAYLWPSVMIDFYEKKFPELKKGTRIISNTFSIQALNPIQVEVVEKTKIYVYEKQ